MLRDDPTLASARELCDTGLRLGVESDPVPTGVFQFVQIGDRFQWAPIALGSAGLGDSDLTGSLVSSCSNVQLPLKFLLSTLLELGLDKVRDTCLRGRFFTESD